MSKAISFSSVSKSYKKQCVLQSIDLDIEAGEFVGLVGLNGIGKTTLIKSMLDLIDIDNGQIEIFGIDHKKNQARSSLTYLPEKFSPPPHLTGKHFITYMLSLHKIEINKTGIDNILQSIDFDTRQLNSSIQHYSKGMIQKLGLAISFLSNKPLMLLDEPMSGLDPKARMHLKDLFANLKQQQNTLFISTHLLTDAASICDRILVLNETQFVYQGSPDKFLVQYHATDYDTAFVNCIDNHINGTNNYTNG